MVVAGFASSIAQQLSIWSEHTVTQDRLLLFGGPFVLDWLLDKAVSAAGEDQQAAEQALINLLHSGLLSSSGMYILEHQSSGIVLYVLQFIGALHNHALSRQGTASCPLACWGDAIPATDTQGPFCLTLRSIQSSRLCTFTRDRLIKYSRQQVGCST